jgi:hypothetical protein
LIRLPLLTGYPPICAHFGGGRVTVPPMPILILLEHPSKTTIDR